MPDVRGSNGAGVTDPYDILGVERDADEAQLKAAYRRHAKVAHPDSGGDSQAFDNLQKAYVLLLDPVRRKVYDDTGYDVEFADAAELQALVMIEKLVTDAVLDERAPGSFDPVAVMQESLSEELRKARFSKSELERHASRIGLHLERLEKQSGRDVLAHMFRARIEAIGKAVVETEAKIKAAERAADMLAGYIYDIDPTPLPEASVTSIEWTEPSRNRSTG
nr:J domain-containing protein [Rhizobium sp. BK619]